MMVQYKEKRRFHLSRYPIRGYQPQNDY